jgi:hypothetical protein
MANTIAGDIGEFWSSTIAPMMEERKRKRIEAMKGKPDMSNFDIAPTQAVAITGQKPTVAPITANEAPSSPAYLDIGPQQPPGSLMEGPAGEASFRKELTPGGVAYDAGTKGYMEGKGVGVPGTFKIIEGPRGGLSPAEWNALSQEEATAIRVAEIDKQRQGVRDMRNARREAEGMPPVGQRRADLGPAAIPSSYMDDVAARNAMMTVGGLADENQRLAKRFVMQHPLGKARREAMQAVSGAFDAPKVAAPGRSGNAAGPSLSDQIALANLDLSANRYALDARTKGAELLQKQQEFGAVQEQRELENELARSREGREQLKAINESVATALQSLPPEFAPMLREAGVKYNKDPEQIGNEIALLLAERDGEYQKALVDGSAELKRQVLDQIRTRILGGLK